MKIRLGIVGIALYAGVMFSDEGYRFVCNGMLANGEQRSDECGECTVETAARWSVPEIPVVIGHKTLPAGLRLDEWLTVARQSLRAWDNIDGTSLKFIEVDEMSRRQFGSNTDVHEIFWITDVQEWRRLVGSGEFGTLGATLPRYFCGDGLGNHRVIMDADLVLNGLPHINWQIDCADDDCLSIQSTLVHELGHFFGLDHPCLLCESSIMSARAGFDLLHPLFDDVKGLRALYPDTRESGGWGQGCTSDEDCSAHLSCLFDGKDNYCSSFCSDDRDCQHGFMCNGLERKKICSFMNADLRHGRVLGQNCLRGPCVEPLVCAGAAEPYYYCYMPCKKDSDCDLNQECIKLDFNTSLCVGIKNVDERCNHRDLCDKNLYCVFNGLNIGFCRKPCEPTLTASTGCDEGEVCELVEGRVELCMPEALNLALDAYSESFSSPTSVDNRDHEPANSSLSSAGCAMSTTGASPFFLLVLCVWILWLKRRKTSLLFDD